MSRSLAKHKTDCSILTIDFGITKERLKALEGVNVVTLPCVNKRFFIPFISYKKISFIVKNADIIHLMGHWTVINIFVYLFAKYYKKPYVICPAGALVIYGRSKTFKRIYDFLIGKRILRNASRVIAITKDEFAQIRSYGINNKRIVLIPNGINPENYTEEDDVKFRYKFKLGDNPFILFVGGLRTIKGPDLLLKAFNNIKDEYKDYNLVFAGNDRGSLSELRKIVNRCDLEKRVHFIGYVDGIWKSKAYHAAELLCIPSRHEAMSIVVLEGGITSTPVLATDQCGLNEISNIGGGIVVPVSLESIEKGIRKMLSKPDNLKEIGEKLYKYVNEQFIWDVLISKYLDLYRCILNED